jgi:sphingolipid delta-4 desaturase
MTKEKLSQAQAEAIIAEEGRRHNTDFEWTYTEEPHASRRIEILKAHPEIKKLFGHHPASKYYAFATVALQLLLAWYVSRPTTSWFNFLFLGYVVGGTSSHSLTLAIHEMSHNLFFKSPEHNMYYSLFCNIPLVFPYAASFKAYHLDHHRNQGVDGIDTDIPTEFEGRFFTTPFLKFLWVLFQPCFYAIRPVIVCPKALDANNAMNIAAQIVAMFTLYKMMGLGAIGYLGFSTWMGLGLHPCAGHFIAEHYTNIWGDHTTDAKGKRLTGQTPFKAGGEELYPDETFTYRGPLNMVSYNVGIHVAHHDFPFIAGFRLPEVERLAPEYYDHLPVTESWPGTIYKYIMGPGNPFDRIKRKSAGKKTN